MAQIKRKSEKEMASGVYQWRNMGAEGANIARIYGEMGMQDAGCWMLDAGCRMRCIRQSIELI